MKFKQGLEIRCKHVLHGVGLTNDGNHTRGDSGAHDTAFFETVFGQESQRTLFISGEVVIALGVVVVL